jgi:catechol 2,3-dioxygenase-like lactoylglutathione lyase family enzyme
MTNRPKMQRTILTTLLLVTTFFLGFAFKSVLTINKNNNMKRVTGIGGIFFKCKDPKATTAWYQKHLGLDTNPYGATFQWYEKPDSTTKAQTQWTPFKEDSKYFEKDFMINYRVENLVALVEELKKEGVTIVDQIETYDYGKFVHILDGDGNKVQLWEAID